MKKPPVPKFCTNCDIEGHTRIECPRRSKGKTHGKYYKKWTYTKKRWFIDNYAENYICYLCGKFMTREETTLDHVIPRSRAPELRYDPNNLRPCCWTCNSKKGSRVYEV
jgi:5-methylcytosine-specific restriction endonuclease McrA